MEPITGTVVTRDRAELELVGTDFVRMLLETTTDERGRTAGVRLSMRHHATWHEIEALLPGDGEELAQRTAAWLLRSKVRSIATRDAYVGDLHRWLTWCTGRRLNPLAVPYEEADAFQAELQHTPRAKGNGVLSPATQARCCSAVSSWYRTMARARLAAGNPFEGADRPRVSSVPGSSMSPGEARAFIARVFAERHGRPVESTRTRAMIGLMMTCGYRVSSILALNVEHLGHDQGHRIVDAPAKGGKTVRRALPVEAAREVDAYLAERGNPASGPLFVTESGARLDRAAVYRLVERLGRAAGLPFTLSPHGLRRTAGATATAAGVPVTRVQTFLAHESLSTTQKYIAAREELDTDPSYVIARDLFHRP